MEAGSVFIQRDCKWQRRSYRSESAAFFWSLPWSL